MAHWLACSGAGCGGSCRIAALTSHLLPHAPAAAACAQGIAGAQLLGLPGSTWRGLDILMAQALLARTLGHALGARSPLLRGLSNLAFPATLLAYTHGLAGGILTLGFASKVLVVVLAAQLAAKTALEGWHTLPAYCARRGPRCVAFFAAGFAFFPLPELFPRARRWGAGGVVQWWRAGIGQRS